MSYNREKALAYARKWAFDRNSAYYDFSAIGGDCTNFISQCLYAGCGSMNYRLDTGWYYISSSKRSAAWSGVEYLYNFLTRNKGPGPYGRETSIKQVVPGDIVQLSFDGIKFSHSLLVTELGRDRNEVLIATHSDDALNRPLDSYTFEALRAIHIEGAR